MGSSPAVEIRGLRKEYGDTVAVDGLDLVVPRGATYALLGPNGSGKTTTIRTLLRIQEPDAGEVRVLGEKPGPGVRDRIGYLPEERGLYPRMKVREVLTFLAELKGMAPRDSRPRIDGWLDRVDLSERADDRVQTLSKGMQQKLQFVAAVVHEPELVILDEPFSGLDPINQQALREIVGEIRRSERTILFSTHIIEHAERLCDHVCILSHGRAVVEGEVGRVKREHGGRHVGLTLDPWTPEAVAAVRAAPEAKWRGSTRTAMRSSSRSPTARTRARSLRGSSRAVWVSFASKSSSRRSIRCSSSASAAGRSRRARLSSRRAP